MHFLYGVLGFALPAVAVHVRLQVRFKDWFQYQLARRLHYSVPNGRDSQRPLSVAIGLRDHFPSYRLRPVALLDQLLPQPRQPFFLSLGLDLQETLSIHSRRSSIGFRQPVSLGQDVLPVDLVIEQVEPVGRFLLRFCVQLPLKLPDFYRRFQTHVNRLSFISLVSISEVRALGSPGITRLPRYYDPLRGPSQPPPLRRMLGCPTDSGLPLLTQITFSTCRAHYPGGSILVLLGIFCAAPHAGHFPSIALAFPDPIAGRHPR